MLHGRLALHGLIVRDGWVRWRWIRRIWRIRRRLRLQPVLPADDAAAANDAAHAAGIRAATSIRKCNVICLVYRWSNHSIGNEGELTYDVSR